MRKCPHCGEPVEAGQETCFACGQKVRVRARRGRSPVNGVLLVVAGAVIVLAVTSLIIVRSRASRIHAAEARKRELARVQDSVRQASKAREDSISSIANTSKEVSDLNAEIGREEQRFKTTYNSVTQGRPSPEQVRLSGAAQSELMRLRQLVQALGATVRETERRQIRADIKAAMGRLRDVTSELGSPPRQKSRTRGEAKPEGKSGAKESSGKPPSGRRPHQKDGR